MSGLKIVPLVDMPKVIPALARTFLWEWEPYYGENGPGDATADLAECCNREKIPLGLVAVDNNGQPLGTIALKNKSLESHHHLGPWLAAFVVVPEMRGQGIGSALVTALEKHARRLGFNEMYTGTDQAINLLKRLGWESISGDDATATSLRGPIQVFQKMLN